MKKIALILILAILTSTVLPCALIMAKSNHISQENPATAQSSYDISIPIWNRFSDILDVMLREGLDNTTLPIDIDDIPTDIKSDIEFTMQTYNALLSDLYVMLNELDVLLDEAELHLNQSEFEETRLKLTDADELVEEIENLLKDLENVNEQIISILGSLAPTTELDAVDKSRARLLATTDRLEKLETRYEELSHQKGLILDVPEQVYPGLPYKVYGQIIYEAETPFIEREVKLLWDGGLIDTVYSYQNTFEMEVTPDDNTTLGEHTLEAIIEPQGEYSGASDNITLTVMKELPEIRIYNTSYNILSRKVKIEGKILSDLPLKNAVVTIELRGISTTLTTDGEFEATLHMPLDLIVMGKQDVKIRVEPSEAWQSSTEITEGMIILDIVALGLISTAFITIGMMIYVRRRGRPGAEEIEILEMPPSQEPTREPSNVSQWEPEGLEGTRGRIFKAYTETMKIVETTTGLSMKSYMTLREFLIETTPKLNRAAEAFIELTHLAEDTLYSPHMPIQDKATRAENLVLILKEALRHGAE